MSSILPEILPELILIATACVLFLLGISTKATARKIAPVLAILALLAVFILQATSAANGDTLADSTGALRVSQFGQYIKMLAAGVGAMFVLLSWPSGAAATGNSALQYGADAGEFFGLLLLSISGIFLVAGANDIILLFLGLELASIPTYIMVSISRPLAVAQEAGVKYFFLGAMAAALMLFGFSYLYGSTGLIDLNKLMAYFAATLPQSAGRSVLSSWQMLAVVMLIAGFSFKMAAAPLHFYAGDVYEGAATPVTALISFVPKTSGLVALIKILFVISGGTWLAPAVICKLLWIIAVLTMTIGNMLGLRQQNVKRLLAYSSVAHSGYLLVGVTSALYGASLGYEETAIRGVLFYLTAYGIMNVGAFGVLMLLPARTARQASSAETFEDLAGAGRQHVGLGLAMAVACFSLTGLPLTVGFFGKVYLLKPALLGHNYWLAAIMMINAAISAGYYLRIVAVMFLRPAATPVEGVQPASIRPSLPILAAIAISTGGTLLFGIILPATNMLSLAVTQASAVDNPPLTSHLSASIGQ
jgi:NADH-quinone oxidoreductase subunit N